MRRRQNIRKPTTPFVAVDVETVDEGRDSLCCLALVRVEHDHVVARACELVQPGRCEGRFSALHGLHPDRLREARGFVEVWGGLKPMLADVEYLAAHNAAFDRAVLISAWRTSQIQLPRVSWVCTLRLARRLWACRPGSLPAVCRRLGIPLDHHDALSDAEACARILIAARSQ